MSFIDEIAAWLDIDPDSPVMALLWAAFLLLATAFLALATFVIAQWTEWYTGRFSSVTGPPRETGSYGGGGGGVHLKHWLAKVAYLGLYLDGCGIAIVLVVLSPLLAIVAMGLAPLIALGVGVFGMGSDEEVGGESKKKILEEKKGQ
ncbi:hypothetical protein ACHAQH_000135 [Verticillium albo-atrum]